MSLRTHPKELYASAYCGFNLIASSKAFLASKNKFKR